MFIFHNYSSTEYPTLFLFFSFTFYCITVCFWLHYKKAFGFLPLFFYTGEGPQEVVIDVFLSCSNQYSAFGEEEVLKKQESCCQ